MSTKTTEWSGTKDGSYLTLEWLNTITRYGCTQICTFEEWEELKCANCLVGVIGAYLCYIQMAVEHNHHEVQIKLKKVIIFNTFGSIIDIYN
jgi:hypothetical protein